MFWYQYKELHNSKTILHEMNSNNINIVKLCAPKV